MNEIVPNPQKECFAQLDKMLIETDKKAIAEAKDIKNLLYYKFSKHLLHLLPSANLLNTRQFNSEQTGADGDR